MGDTEENHWQSRRTYVMVLLCQTMGLPIHVGLAHAALRSGVIGYVLAHLACCLLVGIPLLYMEFIVSQFTARDCISIWKARPCVSHIGYVVVFWQVISLIYNHVLNSFMFHYLLISFENPIPYYTCGRWANKDCNILIYNFTVNQDCIKIHRSPKYCDDLYTSFPEYQYWRFQIMGAKANTVYFVAWRVCLASALLCVIMYISVMKRKRSVKIAAQFFTVFPIMGYVMILMGSMIQKGVVENYDDAIDTSFQVFANRYSVPQIVVNMMFSLEIGSGMTLNLGSGSGFRAPVYSNTVLAVAVVSSTATLVICIAAMMSCPYAFEYGINPTSILKTPLSLIFEKTPRFLFEYGHKYFYLVLTYSSHAALGTGTNVIYILHFVDMAVARSKTVANYPGLTSFFGILAIFFLSMPLMCDTGIKILIILKLNANAFAVFIVIIEILVFVVWYGVNRFVEDVHYMQGVQPKNYMRACWISSVILLVYTYCVEVFSLKKTYTNNVIDLIGWYMGLGSVGLIILIFVIRVLIAACKRSLREVFSLNPDWGPKSEVLRRSRAMFTAQAMTKEYLYRQYHLQAGIAARQRMANIRTKTNHLI